MHVGLLYTRGFNIHMREYNSSMCESPSASSLMQLGRSAKGGGVCVSPSEPRRSDRCVGDS